MYHHLKVMWMKKQLNRKNAMKRGKMKTMDMNLKTLALNRCRYVHAFWINLLQRFRHGLVVVFINIFSLTFVLRFGAIICKKR